MTTTTFLYTGAAQAYVVPTGVTSVVIVCKGASGSPYASDPGGTGALVQGTLAVTPGETLNVYVGGGGGSGGGPVVGAGGFNFGANGGGVNAGVGNNSGNGGGGSSDVRQGGIALANRKIIAGGGGAGARDGNGGGGGALGGNGGNAGFANPGQGGTQSAGGAAGNFGTAGSLALGGPGCFNSGSSTPNAGGGGGGGGYYGGGGGGNDVTTGANVGGGGGGSSNAAGCTATSSTAGINAGNPFTNPNDAYVTIATVDTAPTAPTLFAPINGGFIDVDNAVVEWIFNDPDAGDTQLSADIRYRVLGSNEWTTIPQVVQGSTFTYRLTDLVLGVDYEWQMRAYDAQGVVSPFSSSFTFTVRSHPVVTIVSPVPGQAIASLAGTPIVWSAVRDQYAYVARRVGDLNGLPDTTNVIETHFVGGASTVSFTFTTTGTHDNGPEHWQIQVQTFAGQISSDWEDVAVVMSVNAPSVPTCVATAQPNTGSVSLAMALSELSEDYFFDTSLPTTADTGQALTSSGAPDVTTQPGFLFKASALFYQQATLAGKVLAMACTFRQQSLGSTNHDTNSVYLIATDGSNNAHIMCGITSNKWYIKKNVAGTPTTLASGALTSTITTSLLNAYPWSMSASVSGTTVTFVDPWGVVHTATDAVIGSFTGAIARVQVDNSANNTTDDTWKVARFSASSISANLPAYGYISRSLDGVSFDPIPGAVWNRDENGSAFSYVDYAPPFNRQVWYQVTSVTAVGAISRSAVS